MSPLLMPDDEVLVAARPAYQVGDIVVARHPYRTDVRLIKQLVGWDDSGLALLEGLNPEHSTDSRTLGGIPNKLLLGVVVAKF
jgi:nickel-type superoxide dismutase maturation protease